MFNICTGVDISIINALFSPKAVLALTKVVPAVDSKLVGEDRHDGYPIITQISFRIVKEEPKWSLVRLCMCYYYISIHNNREIYVQNASTS